MEKSGLAKVSVAVSAVALVAAVVSLLVARAGPREGADGPDPLGGLRAEIASLKDSVESCRAAVETSARERAGLAGRIGELEDKLERKLASAAEGARPEVDPELVRELVAEQVRAQLDRKEERVDKGVDEDIKDWFAKMGIGADVVGAVRRHYRGKGFTDEQAAEALAATLKVLHEMREEGERYEMDPRIREWLDGKLGLKREQIAEVEGIARRLRGHLEKQGGEEPREEPPDEKGVF
ncbi:MAG: hypothetical protein ACYS9X_07840 [Planctomycetota bacterium]|jgi:hypothetical protein